MPFCKSGGIHCFSLKQVRDLIAITGKIFLGIDFVFQAIAAFPHILAMHFKSRSRKAGSLVRLAYAGVIAILVAWNITGRANSLVTSRLVSFISLLFFLVMGQINQKHHARECAARESRDTNIGEENYLQPCPACAPCRTVGSICKRYCI